jgi:uncharacterized protein (TIGR04255 family)
MTKELASFERPPVAEVVLGVQFDPLGMTNGHHGWFWKQYLGDDWPKSSDAPQLPDQIESFSPSTIEFPRVRFRIMQSPAMAERLQIVNVAGDHMVQVQDTRFIFNWVKKERDYPRYGIVRRGFDECFGLFREFASKAKLNALKENQWEVTYVNLIPRGELWSTPADWPKIFPGLLRSTPRYGGTISEDQTCEWRSEIPEKRGRLHLSLQRQLTEASDSLCVQLTARGAVNEDTSLSAGLDLGREVIVSSFDDITSEQAHQHWGRK